MSPAEKSIILPPVPVVPSLEEIEELRRQSPALAAATALVITDEGTSLLAQESVRLCDAHIANVEAFFDEGKKASDKLHKWFTGAVASLTKTAREAKAVIGGKVYAYQQAERRRVEAEQTAVREKARREAEEAAIKEAEELTAMGATAEADRVLGKEVVVEVPIPHTPAPAKLEGSSSRENWQWAGVDLMATVKAVAAGTIPLEALTWNGTWITQRTKQMKADANIPGVRTWDKGTFLSGRMA